MEILLKRGRVAASAPCPSPRSSLPGSTDGSPHAPIKSYKDLEDPRGDRGLKELAHILLVREDFGLTSKLFSGPSELRAPR